MEKVKTTNLLRETMRNYYRFPHMHTICTSPPSFLTVRSQHIPDLLSQPASYISRPVRASINLGRSKRPLKSELAWYTLYPMRRIDVFHHRNLIASR